jgi:hypothetical protein
VTAELVFLEGEGEHKHNCGDDRQDQESIQVCQRRRLPNDRSINQSVRLIHGAVWPTPDANARLVNPAVRTYLESLHNGQTSEVAIVSFRFAFEMQRL